MQKITKKLSKALSALLAVSLIMGNMMVPTFAAPINSQAIPDPNNENTSYYINNVTGREGYAIAGIESSGTSITIPDTLTYNGNKKQVIMLGVENEVTDCNEDETMYSILGYDSDVTEITLGENVLAINRYAFLGADLSQINVGANSHYNVENGALYEGNTLIKYFGSAPDYIVPCSEIYCIDGKSFETLNLNNVTKMYTSSLSGDTIGTLYLPPKKIESDGDYLFYGTHISNFITMDNSDYSTTADGKVLMCENQIVKFADSLTSLNATDIPSTANSISPYAFNSVEQYFALEDAIDDDIMENVVFSFREQDEAVMIVNGQVGFCYNSSAKVPFTVIGNPSDYDGSIGGAHSDEIVALMRIGVPYDMLGIFENCFGMTYEKYQNLSETISEGDAALNAMAALIYEIVDGEGTAEEWLQEGIHGNMHDAAVKYAQALWGKLENNGYQDYVYELEIDSAINPLNFTRSGNDYISGDFKIDVYAQSDTNHESPIEGYMCTVDILTPEEQEEPSVIVNETGLTTFKTGETVHLKYTGNIDNIAEDLQKITFAYEKPKLSYYQTGNSYQDILVFGTTNDTLPLSIRVTVNSIQISKVDITTGEELPGAHLEITTEDGETVDEWISTDTPHEVTLDDGKYVLTETTAPDGYETAESITFEIVDGMVADSDNNTIVMEDKPVTTTVPGEATPNDATPDDAKPETTPKYGELFIAKTVTGGSTTKEFDFVLTLSDETINGGYGDVTFVNGIAEFTLAHGEYVDITGLPEDIQYTVEEEEYSGYDTTSVNASGTIKGDELIEVQFINERISSGSSSPTTGRTASSSGNSRSSSSSSNSSTSNYPESNTDNNAGRNPSDENANSEAETHEESNVKIESEDANVPKTGEYEVAACVILAALVIGCALIFKRRKGNI